MGRSKPRTNKRPPPKPNRRANGGAAGVSSGANGMATDTAVTAAAQQQYHHAHDGSAPVGGQGAYFDHSGSLFPPPVPLDPNDPNFHSAIQSWSTSALNQLSQLSQLPRLTPSQLSAIAGAAAGVGDSGLFSAAAGAHGNGNGNAAAAFAAAAVNNAAGGDTGEPTQGLPIDLPASLAALFEAKLTLDREKAKLMRMQKELKGYREGVSAVDAAVGTSGKGKEVAQADDEPAECTCGRNGHVHEYPGSAHSGSDDYYYYDTEDECCDCCSHDHSYIECDHEPGECDCEEYEDIDEPPPPSHHHHPHHHHHHHSPHAHAHHHDGEVDSDLDGHEYADVHGMPGHTCGAPGEGEDAPPGGFEAVVLRADGRQAKLTPEQAMSLFGNPNATPYMVRGRPPYLTTREARAIMEHHNATHQHLHGDKQLKLPPAATAEWDDTSEYDAGGGADARRRLADDPERMDEAVRELFNWIKAVVWTIEQAAIVAGRRGWSASQPASR